MAFYLMGDYIREQRERLGVTQEDLCEGICSPGTLSKIENGRQSVRLNQYIALMERLGLPVQPIGVQVTEEEMEWYRLKREISYKLSANDCDVAEQLQRMESCSLGMEKSTEQFSVLVRAVIKKASGECGQNVLDMLVTAIRYTYPNFDIESVSSVRLLTYDEIMIIDNIGSMLKKCGDVMEAIMWERFLKGYLEGAGIDYDEKARVYPMILYNLSTCLIECHQYEEAIRICSDGIEYCNAHGKLNSLMELIYTKGICCAEIKDRENATLYLTYSFVIAKMRGNTKKVKSIEESFSYYGLSKVIP